MTHPLSALLVSAVHDVELDESGWWMDALHELIIAVVFQNKVGLTRAGLASETQRILGAGSDGQEILLGIIDSLIAGGRLEEDGRPPKLTLPRGESARLDQELSEQLRIDAAAEQRFRVVLAEGLPHLAAADVYRDYLRSFLLPYIQQFGAMAWRLLLEPEAVPEAGGPALDEFLSHYAEADRDQLLSVTVRFLDPADSDVRAYILRLVGAYFLTQSRLFQVVVADDLMKMFESLELDLILDTDIVVAAISHGVTGRPLGRMARPLLDLLHSSESSHAVVASVTLDELREDLLVFAALNAREHVGLISASQERRQFELMHILADSGGASHTDWLRRTAKNLASFVEAHGLRIERQPSRDSLLMTDTVVADTASARTLTRRLGRQKLEREWVHDILLWHFVVTKRRPLDPLMHADWWLLTDDPSLIAWDRNRVEERGGCSGVYASDGCARRPTVQVQTPRTLG